MNRATSREAFTLVEMVVVMVVIGVLVGLLMPRLAGHTRSRRIECLNNQKQIGLGFRIFSADNQGNSPMRAASASAFDGRTAADQAWILGRMSNELSTPKILLCPSDSRVAAAAWPAFKSSNSSYFVGLNVSESLPQVWLAGDRNLETNGTPVGPGLLRLTTRIMRLGWTQGMHDRCGNVVLGDGSVRQWTGTNLQAMLAAQVAATNDLLVP